MADASLFNTVKQNGQVFQETAQDTAGLQQAAGLGSAAPASPFQAAGVGASPDQSKMAGTPASSLSAAVKAMRVNASGNTDLATAIRRQQVSGAQTDAQGAEVWGASVLKQVGTLASRVPDLIQKDLAAAASGPVTLGPNLSAMPAGMDQGTYTAAVTQLLSSDPAASAQGLATLNKAMGGTAANPLDPATIKGLVTSPETSIENKVAGATPDTLTVGALAPGDLGVSSWSDVAWSLGLKDVPGGQTAVQQVQGMTVAQLGQAVQAAKVTGYNTEAQWRSILSDPTSSAQLRGTATMMLKGMGAEGIDAAEKSVAKLTSQVSAANTVTVFGQTLTVDQLLAKTPDASGAIDPTTGKPLQVSSVIQGMIANYLSGDANTQASLKASSPEMASWIDANATELKQVTAGIDPKVQAFATIQANNQAAVAGINAGVRNQLLDAAGIDYTDASATAWTLPPVFAAASSDPNMGTVVSNIAGAYANLPGGSEALKASGLLNMSAGDLQAAGLSNSSTPQYTRLMQNLENYATTSSATVSHDPEVLLTSILGDATPTKDLMMISLASKIQGVALPDNLAGIASAKNPADAAIAMSKGNGVPTVTSLTGPSLAGSMSEALASAGNFLGNANNGLADTVVTDMVDNGGTLSVSSLKDLVANNSSSLKALDSLNTVVSAVGQSTGPITDAINAQVKTQVDSTVFNAGNVFSNADDFANAVQDPSTWNATTTAQYNAVASAIQVEMKDPNVDPRMVPHLQYLMNMYNAGQQRIAQAAADAAAAKQAQQEAVQDAQTKAQTQSQQAAANYGGYRPMTAAELKAASSQRPTNGSTILPYVPSSITVPKTTNVKGL